jgi:uncharacterized protein YfiM (DUF2279 family)
MSVEPFQAVKGELPLPQMKRKAEVRDAVFALLARMEVGEMQEVNRGRRAANAYCYRFKASIGGSKVFTVRASDRPSWSRIWRVQ